MAYKNLVTAALAMVLIIGVPGASFAYGPPPPPHHYGYYYPPPPNYHKNDKAKKALEYGAIGAGAGYLFSSPGHKASNTAAGAAIGAAAGLLTGR